MSYEDKDFEFTNLPDAAKDPEIKAEDFTLQQADKEIHEQKFQTKPTTFLKDSLKRFRKNKSSVVAAYILGFLILLAIFVPIFSPYDVSKAADPAYYNLEPKLFTGGGFWDGTVEKTNVPINITDPDPANWRPDPDNYKEDGISNLKVYPETYTSDATSYGRGGYVQIGYYGGLAEVKFATYETYSSLAVDASLKPYLDLSKVTLTLDKFETVDGNKIVAYKKDSDPNLPEELLPENFELGYATLLFIYEDTEGDMQEIAITDRKIIHNTGSELDVSDKEAININEKIAAKTTQTTFNNFYFQIKVESDNDIPLGKGACSLVKNMVITPSGLVDENVKGYFLGGSHHESHIYVPGISFTDATELLVRSSKIIQGLTTIINSGYWTIPNLTQYCRNVHLGKVTYCSFTYDSYKGSLGKRLVPVQSSDLSYYKDKGWIDYDFIVISPTYVLINQYYGEAGDELIEILDSLHCPLLETFKKNQLNISPISAGGEYTYFVNLNVTYYKYLQPGLTTMPSFLFGTDKTGRDMFTYVFDGLFNSLLLGVITFVVCFLFGLLWGSISGYFGGAVDLIMERFTDILSGVPWIVVMTLVILKTGDSNLGTFALALCLTGWIGTASTTRTQFYRFRGREYVLASRTLGASDGRLIAKHILPNAMGTIITGAVLMIPSVIFSEATISYLGLGFKNLSSLGVILSNNQNELISHPYQLLFPSIVIALVMISFNLFGNGLRDAINPSLKGEDE